MARHYESWAPTYDTDPNVTRDLDAEIVRRLPLALAGGDVMELGCGTGKNTTWLEEQARRVIALDFSGGMLARARERVRAGHVQFVRHDVREPWPVADEALDVVVGSLILEHVADLAPVYAEAKRVLRSGGQLLFSELHPERQRRGGQATFRDPRTGTAIRVPAHRHTVAEYVNRGIEAGLVLRQLGEWTETGAAPEAPPRLVSVLSTARSPRLQECLPTMHDLTN
ncbi:MAG TPA: class I SAM-dependent methyltransferase [Woeseiaceae bacterium]|nr:class I SAM-dependent methyltransferase [Woeseiaceae bacterium]